MMLAYPCSASRNLTNRSQPPQQRNHPWQPSQWKSWRAEATIKKVMLELRNNVSILNSTYVLSGKGVDGRSVLRQDADKVGGRGLVTVSRPPESKVGESSEPSSCLNGLVGRSVFTETNGVVGGNVKDSEVRQGGKSDGTGGVRDEVKESGTERNDTTVGSDTVTDGSHTMLPDTKSEVSTSVATETSRGVLEVLSALPPGQVGTGQVGRTTNQLGQNLSELGDGSLGQLPGTDSSVRRGVGGESLLPTFGETAFNSSLKFSGLLGVLLTVRLEESLPFSIGLGTVLGNFVVEVGSLLRDDEGLLGVETELLLELSNVILLQSLKNKIRHAF